MTATIHQLHVAPPQPTGFLRVGHAGFRKLEQLLSAGRLSYRRFVFDAAHIVRQSELVQALRAADHEIVLDTNVADMGEVGRIRPSISKLPWANEDRAWQSADFSQHRNLDVVEAIAEFAIKQGVTVLLAPNHMIEDVGDPWREIAINMCEALRESLDRAGGKHISIDFPIITTNRILKDTRMRSVLTEGVIDLPIDNIWLRTSGFGADATGAGARHFIESGRNMHDLDHPLVADFAGGYAGLAALAFGAVGGICHGVGVQESFKASQWKRPPSNGGGGSIQRIYIPELDRHFKEIELDAIFTARRGRALFACNDTGCCPHGPKGMRENAYPHFITQHSRQLADLTGVPEARREEHFLSKHLGPATRAARVANKLNVSDENVKQMIMKSTFRLDRLRDSLLDLHLSDTFVTRSRVPRLRSAVQLAQSVKMR